MRLRISHRPSWWKLVCAQIFSIWRRSAMKPWETWQSANAVASSLKMNCPKPRSNYARFSKRRSKSNGTNELPCPWPNLSKETYILILIITNERYGSCGKCVCFRIFHSSVFKNSFYLVPAGERAQHTRPRFECRFDRKEPANRGPAPSNGTQHVSESTGCIPGWFCRS